MTSPPPPPPLVEPENRYDLVSNLPARWDPGVAVVIPVYGQAAALACTLAGLASQTLGRGRFEVVVADDGSEEDVGAVVACFDDRLAVRVVRQEHDGFGAGRARNLGAEATGAEVLLFLDADCIPDPALVERHLWWHRRASNLIVVGSRYYVDAGAVTPDEVEADFEVVRRASHRIPEDGSPDDWRAVFYRRNRRLRIADGAYRAVLSGNMSVPASAFHRVGGFSEAFRSWGGEDGELGWRLWNDGAFVVPEDGAAIFHQVEAGHDPEARIAAGTPNRMLMADRVPHRFYRKLAAPFHLVPRVSWLAVTESSFETVRLWENLSRSTYADAEVVFTGPEEALAPLATIAANPRVRLFEVPSDAVEATRGEFVAIMDGRLEPHRRLLEHAVRRFDRAPRTAVVRGAYDFGRAGSFLRYEELNAIDDRLGRFGLPLFAVVRRRELMKDLHGGGLDWSRLLDRARVEYLMNDTVAFAALGAAQGRRSLITLGPAEMQGAGSEEIARSVVRSWRSRRDGRAGGSGPVAGD